MYEGLGIHWASSVPAFLALACVPVPFLFYKYGASIRKRCKFAAEAAAFLERLRNQSDHPEHDSEPEEEEYEKEQEAEATPVHEGPTYEGIKATRSRPASRPNGLTSTTSRGSAREYDGNPYDIDRVNTRDSFKRGASREGSRSRAASKSRDTSTPTKR